MNYLLLALYSPVWREDELKAEEIVRRSSDAFFSFH